MKKKKIPKKAVKPLMHTCKYLSEDWGKPATTIFKKFLELMNRYAEYFFSQPWTEKYDFDKATKFTEEDVDFLNEGEDEEFADRLKTVFLKKNINLEFGFQGYFGYFWTSQAFHRKFVRPTYKPVQEDFENLRQGDRDPRNVLDKLKEKFSDQKIHNSLVDLVEHQPMQYVSDKPALRLLASILELMHEEEGLPPCHDHRCEWAREELQEIRENGGVTERSLNGNAG